MDFEKFKEKIMAGLREIYKDNAELEIGIVEKNGGGRMDGIKISLKASIRYSIPVIGLDKLYEAYCDGKMGMYDCIRSVYDERTAIESNEDVVQPEDCVMDWNYLKDKVYPILLSPEEDKEPSDDLVSTKMLDMLVAYVIREEIPEEGYVILKFTWDMMRLFGVGFNNLHRLAMKNLEKDGYKFRSMDDLTDIISRDDTSGIERANDLLTEVYVLTNKTKDYGAAGILNTKLIKRLAKGRDFFILLPSIHEAVFIPVQDVADKEIFDRIAATVTECQVSKEERLSDHSYYYDAETEEIRIYA